MPAIEIPAPIPESVPFDLEQMRSILRHLKEVVFQTDAAGRWTYLSPAWSEITGFAVEETLGRVFLDAVHPDDREGNLERFRPLIAREKESCRHEVRYLRKNAEPCWIEVHARLTLDRHGEIIGTSGTLSDVTARRIATDRLRETTAELQKRETLHEAMMAASPIGLLVVDPASDRILRVSDRFCELTCLAGAADAMRRGLISASDLREAIRLQTADGVGARDLLRGPNRQEITMRDGRVLSIHGTEVRDPAHGSYGCLFGVEDVTAMKDAERAMLSARAEMERHADQRTRELSSALHRLRESEELYRTVVETSPDALLFTSMEGRVEMVNERAVSLFHWESAEAMDGLRIEHLVKAESASALRNAWEETRRGASQNVECWLRRHDGSLFFADISGSIVPDPSGGTRFLVVDIRDNTPRRQLEEQLLQAQKMDAVGRLAGGVAHDFNNLLTVIKGYSELLLKKLPAGETTTNRVAQIARAADRAAGLVGQLLAFSRKQSVEPKIIDVNRAITDLHKMLRRLIGENIALDSVLDPRAGCVRIDPTQFDQMIINLAVNARDAIGESGRITIRTHALDSAVAISIADTGAGMTEEVRSKIFEPFFTTKEVGKGTGLGLSTVYGIVEQAGGRIVVTTAPGEGTTMEVRFGSTVPENAASEEEGDGESARGCGTILVAEDEDLVRAMIVETLEDRGYRVIEVRDGREAIEAARAAGPIDLLLSDVVMPQISGTQLRDEISRIRPETRVILMSGYAEHDTSQEAWLQKPFDPRTLADRVRDVLR
ncbi:MAG: PAS domain S-box protein [Acidobacteriia bacterium]|nr:PAS domain S-box protein [Terriglobia bacterium]